MRLGTTTWQFRNSGQIRAVMQEAVNSRLMNPVILDVGPGAMSAIGRFLHPGGNSDAWTGGERFWGAMSRFSDNLARTVPVGRVSCPEMEEVYQASMALNPSKLIFIDLQQRVLDAGHRFARLLNRPELFEFRCQNIVTSSLKVQADIVISYTVLGRVSDRVQGTANICSAVRPGGLLSISAGEPPPGFIQVNRSLYRKLPAQNG